ITRIAKHLFTAGSRQGNQRDRKLAGRRNRPMAPPAPPNHKIDCRPYRVAEQDDQNPYYLIRPGRFFDRAINYHPHPERWQQNKSSQQERCRHGARSRPFQPPNEAAVARSDENNTGSARAEVLAKLGLQGWITQVGSEPFAADQASGDSRFRDLRSFDFLIAYSGAQFSGGEKPLGRGAAFIHEMVKE